MANKGLAMGIVEEVQRLKNLNHSQRKVSEILGISRNTVSKYWDESFKLEKIIHEPDWFKNVNQKYILSEVENGVPKNILYDELKAEVSLPSYQAFSRFLKNKVQTKENTNAISLRQERVPGMSTEVDYSGDSIPIFTPSTGEIKKTELFVGVLSYSSYIFAEFTFTQTLKDFLISHVNMFKAFGGLTKFIVVDNLKSGFTKTDVYDPEINKAYHDMCTFYGISVDPARPYKPKDKPVVENAVGLLQRSFFPSVREKTYTSLFELNKDLKEFLILQNRKTMKDRGGSREFFYLKEKKLFKPLPVGDYKVFSFKKAKVHPDCHVRLNHNFYSVPYVHVGKEVIIKFNQNLVQIVIGSEVVATHTARRGRGQLSTNTEHYPEKKWIEESYLIQSLLKKAKAIGEQTLNLSEHLLNAHKHPLKNLRKAQAILNLKTQFDSNALEYASEMCLRFEKYTYGYAKSCCSTYLIKEKNKINNTIQRAPNRLGHLVCLQGGEE